ncbi:MAG: ABC transporter ATP-binding protein [Lachnospiraceae bacterium]|nr:ABC transporter ATP-binding protein [Lachnospiraceae bacterium]
MEIIKVENVNYSYKTKYQTVHAVKNVSCSFEKGLIYAIVGESGSGKSTLLSLLAGLDVADDGCITVEGKDLSKINRDHYRRDTASVVYQSFQLFPLLTAKENVMYPMEMKKIKRKEAAKKAEELLISVGLTEKIFRQFPLMMSGGEQQRVAIARALSAGGKILLADEPTGNLDTENEQHIVELLKKLAHEKGYTVIVITHNPEVAKEADATYRMRDGCLTAESKTGEAYD